MTWNSTPVTRLQYFENEVVQRVRSESPELRESNTQCYIIENDDENFFIRDNMLYGVFDEIYSPRRHGTGDRRLFYVSPPAVFRVEAKKDRTATFHELTLAKGALILAVGNHKSMQNLFETLNKLVSDAKIITIVKDSYKSGFTLVRQLKTSRNISELEQLFSRIEYFGWLSRAFPMDI